MFKELINNLKRKKQKLEDYTTYVKPEEKIGNVNISVTEENGFYKIEISDYISILEYIDMTEFGGIYNILSSISNAVLWNSRKQKVDKGIYYVINIDNHLYNIFINDEKIQIDERIQKEVDEERNKDNITEERIITFYVDSREYRYTSFRHDNTGDTYYTKYYGHKGYDLGNFELSDEETFEDINLVLCNLSEIKNIESIIDINFVKEHILKDLSERISNKKV